LNGERRELGRAAGPLASAAVVFESLTGAAILNKM